MLSPRKKTKKLKKKALVQGETVGGIPGLIVSQEHDGPEIVQPIPAAADCKQNILSLGLEQCPLEENGLPVLLERFRDMLTNDEQCLRKDDEFLGKFIRVRNYNLDRALNSVRNYYANIERNQDILTSTIRPSQFISVYNDHHLKFLKGKCRLGSIACYAQPGIWDTNKHTMLQIQQAHFLILEEIIQYKDTQLNGISCIVDFTGLSFAHVRQISPQEIKRLLFLIQDGVPLKVTSLHMINYPLIFWGIYYIAQQFMKEKIRSRIHFHSNLKSLHQHFELETLPKCLGGPLEFEDAIDAPFFEQLIKSDKCIEEYYS